MRKDTLPQVQHYMEKVVPGSIAFSQGFMNSVNTWKICGSKQHSYFGWLPNS